MSGWIFLAIGAAIAVADLFVALGMTRARAELVARAGADAPDAVAQRNRAGRVLIVAAFLFFLVFVAIAFGLVPIGGVEPILFS